MILSTGFNFHYLYCVNLKQRVAIWSERLAEGLYQIRDPPATESYLTILRSCLHVFADRFLWPPCILTPTCWKMVLRLVVKSGSQLLSCGFLMVAASLPRLNQRSMHHIANQFRHRGVCLLQGSTSVRARISWVLRNSQLTHTTEKLKRWLGASINVTWKLNKEVGK